MTPIRVAIADKHTFVRAGTHSLLNQIPDISVIGDSFDENSTLNMVRQLTPDILLLGTNLPSFGSIGVVREIRRESLKSRILVLSCYESSVTLGELIKNNVSGCLSKEEDPEVIISTIRNIAIGRNGLFNNRLLNPSLQAPDSLMTNREHQISNLISMGYKNKRIADELHISISTVKNHISNIFKKLDVTSRAEIICKKLLDK